MRTFIRAKCLFASLLFLVSASVHAEPDLSLNEAIRLATQNQPLLQSMDDASAASREASIASGQLPDPQLRIGIANLPVTGSDTARFDRDDTTMSTVGVIQEMVPRSKREAATRGMQAAAAQFQTEKSATASSIQRDAALAWLDVFETQRRTELYQRIVDEMIAERKVMVSRVSSGSSQAGDVLKLDLELSMIKDKRITALRDERKARAVLARWIGSASLRPIPADLAVSVTPAIQNGAGEINNHPLMKNAQQIEAVAQSEADQAKAERELNWSWEVMYGKRRSDLSDMVTFQIAFDLPWDRPNRQDRRTAEKLILVEKARKLTEDRRRELTAELENAMADAEGAKARNEEHERHLIPSAQARLKIAQAGYESGKQNLSDVWETRRGLIQVEIEHWSVLTDVQRAAVKLSYLLNDNRLIKDSP